MYRNTVLVLALPHFSYLKNILSMCDFVVIFCMFSLQQISCHQFKTSQHVTLSLVKRLGLQKELEVSILFYHFYYFISGGQNSRMIKLVLPNVESKINILSSCKNLNSPIIRSSFGRSFITQIKTCPYSDVRRIKDCACISRR